jgi:hypothetical protein
MLRLVVIPEFLSGIYLTYPNTSQFLASIYIYKGFRPRRIEIWYDLFA